MAVNRKGNWFPPYIYTHAHAHEEGIYANEANKEEQGRHNTVATATVNSDLKVFIIVWFNWFWRARRI